MVTQAIYHCHTSFCGDSQVPPEESVCKAIDEGFAEIGFSLHTPWPNDPPDRLPTARLTEYIAEITRLKEKYAGKIKILCGMEGEYDPKLDAYFRMIRATPGLDYSLYALHYYDIPVGTIDVNRCADPALVLSYADRWIQGMGTGMFAYAVHPEYYMLGTQGMTETAQATTNKLLAYAKRNNLVLGYDMKYFFRRSAGKSAGIPFPEFWRQVLSAGIDVCVELDAHDTRDSWRMWTETGERQLKELGFKRIVTAMDMRTGKRRYGAL